MYTCHNTYERTNQIHSKFQACIESHVLQRGPIRAAQIDSILLTLLS